MADVLVIDSSTDAIAIACGSSLNDSASRCVTQQSAHSENILTAVEEVLGERGIAMSDLVGVGVGVGPGLFTGLRVGIAAAHSFVHALDIPLVYFSSLELSVKSSMGEQGAMEVLVGRDARRHEMYCARFMRAERAVRPIEIDTTTIATSMTRISNEQLMSPANFASVADAISYLDVYCVNDLYEEFSGISEEGRSRIQPINIDARYMIDLVVQSIAAGIVVDPFTPSALYIRKSDAELSWGVPS